MAHAAAGEAHPIPPPDSAACIRKVNTTKNINNGGVAVFANTRPTADLTTSADPTASGASGLYGRGY